MQNNKNLFTNEITNDKEHLNVHRGKNKIGENYFDTYASVVTCFTIRLLNKNLFTNETTNDKERLNVHRGKNKIGENYFDTYASVVTCFTIRLLIICAIVLN